MPRSKQSKAGALLEFYRTGDPGEVRIIHQLAQDILKARFTEAEPKPVVHRKPRVKRSAALVCEFCDRKVGSAAGKAAHVRKCAANPANVAQMTEQPTQQEVAQ